MSSPGPLLYPPGPVGLPLIGKYPAFRKAPADFLLETATKYGDISYFRMGGRHTYLLNRPDFIQEVLVTAPGNFVKSLVLQRAKPLLGEGLLTSEGSFHLRQRRLMQPAFHRQRLMRYAGDMVASADRARSRWQDGQSFDVAEEMTRLTLDIVGRTLFSRDVEQEAAEIGAALTAVLGNFDTLLSPYADLVRHLPLPSIVRANRAQQFLDATIYKMIAERRQSGEDRGDLLSMLLIAQDDDRAGMTDRQVRDEAMTLFLAGHETTATALTWTWYLLSQHPQVEARMRAEVIDVLGGRLATFDDFARLPYTEMVLAESMRLYPPAWAIGRMVCQPYRLYNHELAPGSICIMSPYVMHRHPRYFPDPERFDPERFTPEAKVDRPKFAYFPFGGGPRICIGERFAWLEGVLVLATITQMWSLKLLPGQIIKPRPQITLRTQKGIRMQVERSPLARARGSVRSF